MNYKISVIIPLYNNEEFINQCLDSIINQTFKDFEIIIVDDGSTDNSLKIVKEYENKYDFITVFQQKNQYAGVARNLGMKHAKGDYLLFLDSDDFFELDMLEKIYNQAMKTNADIVLFDGRKYDYINDKYIRVNYFFQPPQLPNREVFSARDEDVYIYQITNPCPWTKLLKSSFINELGIEYSNTKNTNDYYFTTIALAAAKRITYVNKLFINYRVNNVNSLQTNVGKGKLNIAKVLDESYDDLKARGLYNKNIERSFISAAVDNLVYNMGLLPGSQEIIDFYNSELAKLIDKLNILSFDNDYYIRNKDRKSFQDLKGILNGIKFRLNLDKYSSMPEIRNIKISQLIKQSKVSIIVYVYNNQHNIISILDYLVNQPLKEIEIICVDDGSTDNSLELIKEFGKNKDCISIINQEHYGLALARNNGVKIAKGEYLYFIDASTIIENCDINKMYEIASLDEVDILYFNDDSSKLKTSQNVVSGIKLISYILDSNNICFNTHQQLINKDFFIKNNCWFEPKIIHADYLFTFKSILSSSRVKYSNNNLCLLKNEEVLNDITNKNFINVYADFITYIEMIKYYDKLKNLNESEKIIINKLINNIIIKTRNDYSSLPIEQRKTVDFLPTKDKFMFQINVLNLYNKYDEVNRLKNQKNKLIHDNKNLIKTNESLTKRLNKILNHPIMKARRKIKRLFK